MRADVSKDSLAPQSQDSPNLASLDGIRALIQRFQESSIPLVRSSSGRELVSDLTVLAGQPPGGLFPGVRCPEGALAGLLLATGHWSAAHELVDDMETPDGCYWHALIHRMEPDTWNSDYWFRQVGCHPLFPEVLAAARRLAAGQPDARLRFDAEWNPAMFNSWCEQARQQPQLTRSALVAAIHSTECHLLWNYSVERQS